MPKYRRGAGSVYKRGKTWWLKYYVDGKAVYESSGVTDRAEARRILQEKIGELAKRQLAKKRDVLPAADLDIRSVGECVYFVQSQQGGPVKIGYSKRNSLKHGSMASGSRRCRH
jgi:hypothetical protein